MVYITSLIFVIIVYKSLGNIRNVCKSGRWNAPLFKLSILFLN